MTAARILAGWLIASMAFGLLRACILFRQPAPAHLQPPQHAAGSDSERDTIKISNFKHKV